MSKARLQQTKRLLELSTKGYDILDKKATILTKEITDLKARRTTLLNQLTQALTKAQNQLTIANIQNGLNTIEKVAISTNQTQISILKGSIMGIEVSLVNYNEEALPHTHTYYADTKSLLILISIVDNSINRLNYALKKTEIRANALKNIVIPKHKNIAKNLVDTLEEQEREESVRIQTFFK